MGGNNVLDIEINILLFIKGGLIVKLFKICFDGICVDLLILVNMNFVNINMLCILFMI